ncbi:MAG: hypothetical protein NT069_34245 [Planctomycetota bacterium]|nr:hypothetical protein [Planctomycetota bacterium]
MSLSALPLSYCTNVHPGRNLAEVLAGLRQFTVPMRAVFGHPLAAGLWLAAPVVSELLAQEGRVADFVQTLAELGLPCHTLNAFPYGDFHSQRVKENVYLPDWSHPARLKYTIDCAKVLAALLVEGTEGSISTVPLGFKGFSHSENFLDDCIAQLLTLARHLKADRTGTVVCPGNDPGSVEFLRPAVRGCQSDRRTGSRPEASGGVLRCLSSGS